MAALAHSHLDPEQLACINASTPLLSVVAPAGTGKTTLLAWRYRQLLERGYDPDSIAILSFSNLARDAVVANLAALLPDLRPRLPLPDAEPDPVIRVDPDLMVSTFHGFCHHILRSHAIDGIPGADFRILPADQAPLRMRAALAALKLLPDDAERADRSITSALNHLAAVKQTGALPMIPAHQDPVPRVHDAPPLSEDLQATLSLYQETLFQDRLLEPDDLPLMAYRMLHLEPAIRAAWSRRYRHIMVDEYQDTDLVLTHLLRMIGRYASIDVCGDPTQSIYEWRNAIGSFHHLSNLAATHGPPETRSLRHDYRLTRPIQQAAWKLRRAIDDDDPAMTGFLPATRDGPAPHHTEVADPSLVAPLLTERIREDVSADPDTGYHDTAILVRMHAEAVQIAQELSALDIPVWIATPHTHGGPVHALKAWLATLREPSDAALTAALTGHPYQIVPAAIDQQRLSALVRNRSLWQQLGQPHLPKALRPAAETLTRIHERHGPGSPGEADPLYSQILAIIRELQLQPLVETASRAERLAWTANLTLLQSLARRSTSLQHLLSLYDLRLQAGQAPPPDHVQIRTMHSSKGFEFHHVHALNWTEGHFPPYWLRGDDTAERRLAYVAVTRASRSFRSYSLATNGYGRATRPNRFVIQMDLPITPATTPVRAAA